MVLWVKFKKTCFIIDGSRRRWHLSARSERIENWRRRPGRRSHRWRLREIRCCLGGAFGSEERFRSQPGHRDRLCRCDQGGMRCSLLRYFHQFASLKIITDSYLNWWGEGGVSSSCPSSLEKENMENLWLCLFLLETFWNEDWWEVLTHGRRVSM